MNFRCSINLVIIAAVLLYSIGIIAPSAISFVYASKIDCHPLSRPSKVKCELLGCVWDPIEDDSNHNNKTSQDNEPGLIKRMVVESISSNNKWSVGEPWCYFPKDYVGYNIVEWNQSETRYKLKRTRPSNLPNDIDELIVEIDNFGPLALRLRIYDANKKRFEPDVPKFIEPISSSPIEEKTGKHPFNQFEVKLDEGNLIIKRRSTNAMIFNTNLRKLIYSDQFIQLNSKLNSPLIYGLGQHLSPFLKLANESYKTYTFYSLDKLPLPGGKNSYGSFPFYINLESTAKQNAHGVYLHNSNAMDIVLQSDQSITFRPIGGILDFIIFNGPSPNHVINQFQQTIGLPHLPPRWALGFHLCRWNYSTLAGLETVMQRTRAAGIPLEAVWADIDFMEDNNDFTYDRENFARLPEFVDKLHRLNMHFVTILDPGISQEANHYPYKLGKQMDIFIKNATNQILVSKVWNKSGKTVFPDFSNPNTLNYWAELVNKFHDEVKFDGIWLDMNEIATFVQGSLDGCPEDNPIERPPYTPGGVQLQAQSLCLTAKHYAGLEYNVHGLFSLYQAMATYKALQLARPTKRSLLLTRATRAGQGAYSGHWTGDVDSRWEYMRWSIAALIEHNMYGFSLVGTDLCGFWGDTTVELCARWSTLGAFYSFTRNHNNNASIEQDPVALGPIVVEANKNALSKKYYLLPYLYSLVHRAHRFGEPVVRSVPFEFYVTDKEALKVEQQFLWGEALMISPIVIQDTYIKSTYLPRGRWYETNIAPINGTTVFREPRWIDSKGEWYESNDISLTDIALFYRGGYILPIYKKMGQTVADTTNQPIGFDIALCESRRARGELIIDDGESLDGKYNHMTMEFDNNKLSIMLNRDDYAQSISIGQVRMLGITNKINGVRVNNHNIAFVQNQHVLTFDLNSTSVTKIQQIIVELL